MPTRDLHKKSFDSETLTKLELFKEQAKGFLGVFVGSGRYNNFNVNVFDFFCGPGVDKDGNEGSCILLLRELQALRSSIQEHRLKVDVFLNDSDQNKVALLKDKLVALKLDKGPYSIRTTSKEFLEVFATESERMGKSDTCNLVLIDQNGIKQFPPDVFKTLRKFKLTDFMVFMSSSYAWRYQDAPAMMRYLETKKAFGDSVPFYDTHRAIVNYYRSLIPKNERYYLAPFSIKKGSNIYGVLFGSGNLKGVEKFLEAAWKLDAQRGEANFDIDREGKFSNPGELGLDFGPVSKEVDFHRELKAAIVSKRLGSNGAVYQFTIDSGFLPKHAKRALDELAKEGIIDKVKGVSFKATREPTPINFL